MLMTDYPKLAWKAVKKCPKHVPTFSFAALIVFCFIFFINSSSVSKSVVQLIKIAKNFLKDFVSGLITNI
jgi:hypothetical protein